MQDRFKSIPGHMFLPAEYFMREMNELSKRAGLHWRDNFVYMYLLTIVDNLAR